MSWVIQHSQAKNNTMGFYEPPSPHFTQSPVSLKSGPQVQNVGLVKQGSRHLLVGPPLASYLIPLHSGLFTGPW